ncbi:MAG: hypothetical protein N4A36_02875 [Candidatus Gracilibacteria bacterium]|jgi:hypothetical protein|nr:hypothetical protein [Candidatus Gracilibacteria bacterium]
MRISNKPTKTPLGQYVAPDMTPSEIDDFMNDFEEESLLKNASSLDDITFDTKGNIILAISRGDTRQQVFKKAS